MSKRKVLAYIRFWGLTASYHLSGEVPKVQIGRSMDCGSCKLVPTLSLVSGG